MWSVERRRGTKIILYNNVGLTYKASEEMASESTENCGIRQPHCRLMPLSREHPRISHKPYTVSQGC